MLEGCHFFICEGVGLGDDRDQIDLGVEAAHDFDVERFQRVACGLDEVDACMHSVVDYVHAIDLVLCFEVGIEALFDVLHDWSPRVIVVDKVPKARGVDDGQAQANPVLFDISTDRLDGDGLWYDVQAWAFTLSWGVERSVEERVDQCRFAQS